MLANQLEMALSGTRHADRILAFRYSTKTPSWISLLRNTNQVAWLLVRRLAWPGIPLASLAARNLCISSSGIRSTTSPVAASQNGRASSSSCSSSLTTSPLSQSPNRSLWPPLTTLCTRKVLQATSSGTARENRQWIFVMPANRSTKYSTASGMSNRT